MYRKYGAFLIFYCYLHQRVYSPERTPFTSMELNMNMELLFASHCLICVYDVIRFTDFAISHVCVCIVNMTDFVLFTWLGLHFHIVWLTLLTWLGLHCSHGLVYIVHMLWFTLFTCFGLHCSHGLVYIVHIIWFILCTLFGLHCLHMLVFIVHMVWLTLFTSLGMAVFIHVNHFDKLCFNRLFLCYLHNKHAMYLCDYLRFLWFSGLPLLLCSLC